MHKKKIGSGHKHDVVHSKVTTTPHNQCKAQHEGGKGPDVQLQCSSHLRTPDPGDGAAVLWGPTLLPSTPASPDPGNSTATSLQ